MTMPVLKRGPGAACPACGAVDGMRDPD